MSRFPGQATTDRAPGQAGQRTHKNQQPAAMAAPIVGDRHALSLALVPGRDLGILKRTSDCMPGHTIDLFRRADSKAAQTWKDLMGDVLTFSPIQQSGFWRVKMAWPGNSPRLFGWFVSQSDAERWIEEHRWLTTQNHDHQEKAPETS